MEFVSLSVLSDDDYSFHREEGADWPQALGVSWQTLRKLDALDLEPIDGGVAVRTSLIVIDREGKIFWTDGGSRFMHQPLEGLLSETETQIRAALEPQTNTDTSGE